MRLMERKIDRIAATGARIVAVGNPGCAIQLSYGARTRGLRIEIAHPVDLLARAYGLSGAKISHS
jgi:glycolate oxidase iron-sulfur subunit